MSSWSLYYPAHPKDGPWDAAKKQEIIDQRHAEFIKGSQERGLDEATAEAGSAGRSSRHSADAEASSSGGPSRHGVDTEASSAGRSS